MALFNFGKKKEKKLSLTAEDIRTAAKLATALKMDFFPELRPQEVTQKLPNMV